MAAGENLWAMHARAHAREEAKARIIKALGPASRLMMMAELARGERCVGDLQAIVGSHISTVIKHLSVLKAAGIAADDKRGRQGFYRLRVPCLLNSTTARRGWLGLAPNPRPPAHELPGSAFTSGTPGAPRVSA